MISRQRHYFAYGSNLHLQQMAERCPNSTFIGRAVLPDHRFQINERGVANIVYSRGSRVEGLLYLLDGNDEAHLDRNEGVPWAYQKEEMEMQVWTGCPYLTGRTTAEIVALRLLDRPEVVEYYRSSRRNHQHASRPSSAVVVEGFGSRFTRALRQLSFGGPAGSTSHQHRQGGIRMSALVYLSRNYTSNGHPRKEYIKRMNKAIADAIKLGVSREYMEKVVRRHIPPERVRDEGSRPIAAAGVERRDVGSSSRRIRSRSVDERRVQREEDRRRNEEVMRHASSRRTRHREPQVERTTTSRRNRLSAHAPGNWGTLKAKL